MLNMKEDDNVFLLKAPISLGILTTNRCNLKCKHCMNSAGNVEEEELSTNQIIDLIEQAYQNNIHFVEFNGGEFFVREDVDILLDYAIKKERKIVITTNATLISDRWIEKYKNKITLIRISLDSHIGRIHDEFRGVKGAFDKTVDTIKKLTENGYKITVLTTITKSRVECIEDFIKFLIEIKVKGLHTTMLLPAGRGENLVDDVLTPIEHREFSIKYRNLKNKYIGKVSLDFLEESPQICLLSDKESTVLDRTKCGAGFTEIVVLNDGYVLPCASFIGVRDKYRVDELDITKNSLVDIYKNASLMKCMRNVHLIGGKCKDCEYKLACGGGCRAAADIVNDDLLSDDPMCWYKK